MYFKECTFCKEKIRMSDQSGKWLPYSLDGKVHECMKNGKQKQEPTTPSVKIPKQETNFDHNDILALEDILNRLKSVYGDLETYLREDKK